jgi:hypothetical protein
MVAPHRSQMTRLGRGGGWVVAGSGSSEAGAAGSLPSRSPHSLQKAAVGRFSDPQRSHRTNSGARQARQ